jgi:hypothetical protein
LKGALQKVVESGIPSLFNYSFLNPFFGQEWSQKDVDEDVILDEEKNVTVQHT